MGTDPPTEVYQRTNGHANQCSYYDACKIAGKMHLVHGYQASGVTHHGQYIRDESSFAFTDFFHVPLVHPFVQANEK